MTEEEKCGLGCKIAKAKNKTLSYAKKAYHSANEAYDEYKTTNAKYVAEGSALRKTAVPSGRKKKKSTASASAKKENTLGHKIYKAIETAATNASKNPDGPFSLYSDPAPARRRGAAKTKAASPGYGFQQPQETGWGFNLPETNEWDFNFPDRFGEVPKASTKKRKTAPKENTYENGYIRLW